MIGGDNVQLSIFCPVRRGVGVMGIRESPKYPFCYFFQKHWKIDKL